MTPPKPQEQKDWILVPKVATDDMKKAADWNTDLTDVAPMGDETLSEQEHRANRLLEFGLAWEAMLAAAPSPPPAHSDERVALDRYRYAVGWIESDAWDLGEDARSRLRWARNHDIGPGLDTDEFAQHAAEYFADSGQDSGQARAARTTDAGAGEEEIAKDIVEAFAALYNEDGSRVDPTWQDIARIIAAHTSAPAALATPTVSIASVIAYHEDAAKFCAGQSETASNERARQDWDNLAKQHSDDAANFRSIE